MQVNISPCPPQSILYGKPLKAKKCCCPSERYFSYANKV
jgi:hypothetical protein